MGTTATRKRITKTKISKRKTDIITLTNKIPLILIFFIVYTLTAITNNGFNFSMNMLVLVHADETNSITNKTTSTNNTNSTNSTESSNITTATTNNTDTSTNSTESHNQTIAIANETSISTTNNTNLTTISISSAGVEEEVIIKPNYWQGCRDPVTNKYEQIKKGEKMTICIVVSKGGNWAKQTNGN